MVLLLRVLLLHLLVWLRLLQASEHGLLTPLHLKLDAVLFNFKLELLHFQLKLLDLVCVHDPAAGYHLLLRHLLLVHGRIARWWLRGSRQQIRHHSRQRLQNDEEAEHDRRIINEFPLDSLRLPGEWIRERISATCVLFIVRSHVVRERLEVALSAGVLLGLAHKTHYLVSRVGHEYLPEESRKIRRHLLEGALQE